MSRNDHASRHGSNKDHPSGNAPGTQPASSLSAPPTGEANADGSNRSASDPETALHSIGRPGRTSHLEESFTRALKDALAAQPARRRNPPSWSDLPKVTDLLRSSPRGSRIHHVEPTRPEETKGTHQAASPFGDLLGVTSVGSGGSSDGANESMPAIGQGSMGDQATANSEWLSGTTSKEFSVLGPVQPHERSGQIVPGHDSREWLAALTSSTGQEDHNSLMPEASLTRSDPTSKLSASSFSPLGMPIDLHNAFSDLSEKTDQQAGSPGGLVGGDGPSTSETPTLSAVASKSAPIADFSRLSSSFDTFAPFLGDPSGISQTERDSLTSESAWTQKSILPSDGQSFFGSSSSPLTTSESSSGSDLSKTNELLQQLLDEFRKSRQGYLPLNDRNSSTF